MVKDNKVFKVCAGKKEGEYESACGWSEDGYCDCGCRPLCCIWTKEAWEALPTKPVEEVFNELNKGGKQ